MTTTFPRRALAATAAFAACAVALPAAAQTTVFKAAVARYTTDSKTNGVTGVGVPPGADAETGNATTALLIVERMVTPNVGIELALGIPPKIDAKASGSVAFLGEVLSARIVAPTLLANWHFGEPDVAWRPYVGVGINYTRFTDIRSSLAPDVELKDSVGLALNAGLEYRLDPKWSLWASATAIKTKSKLVASGATVLQTSIDFRPVVYAAGVAYRY